MPRERRNSIKRLASVVGLTSTLILAPMLSASASNRAQIINDHYCYQPGVTEYCATLKGHIQSVTTPSGNSFYNVKMHLITTESVYGTLVFSYSYEMRSQGLALGETAQVTNDNSSFSILYDGQTCTGTSVIHAANGEVHVEENTYDCST